MARHVKPPFRGKGRRETANMRVTPLARSELNRVRGKLNPENRREFGLSETVLALCELYDELNGGVR